MYYSTQVPKQPPCPKHGWESTGEVGAPLRTGWRPPPPALPKQAASVISCTFCVLASTFTLFCSVFSFYFAMFSVS